MIHNWTSKSQIPNSDALPLIYPFQAERPAMWYEVVDAQTIQILEWERNAFAFQDDFPYQDFPASFPETKIRISRSKRIKPTKKNEKATINP